MFSLFLLTYMCCFLDERNSYYSRSQFAFAQESKLKNQTTQHPQRLPSSRISGGRRATLSEFPFMVSIQDEATSKHICGGTLLRPTKVLTACHCVLSQTSKSNSSDYKVIPPSSLFLEAGIIELMKSEKNRQKLRSRQINVHPKCELVQEFQWKYDLAVVTAQSSFKPTAYVSPIQSLVKSAAVVERMIDSGVECTTAGWGMTSKNGPLFSKFLMTTTLSLISSTLCNDMLDKVGEKFKRKTISVNTKYQMCTFGEGEKDPCHGDSGGPLLCKDLLFGVMSWGYGCGVADSPAIYARIDNSLSWIFQEPEKSKRKHESGSGSILESSIIIVTSMWILF